MINSPVQPELTEHNQVTRSVSRLQAALDASRRDNAHLQRELSAVRAENRRLRDQLESHAALRTPHERRRMLSEQWSRNP